MKSKLLALAVAATFAVCANAAPNAKTGLEHSVMPKVTDLGFKPKSAMFIGSSIFYYNNVVGSHVKNFVKAGKDKFRQTTVTISSAGLDWHPVKAYLSKEVNMGSYYTNQKNELEQYDFTKEKRYDVVMMLYSLLSQLEVPAIYERQHKAFKKHVKDVREAGSTPMVVMNYVWPDAMEKTQKMADTTIRDANELGVMVVPTGLAFAECVKRYPEIVIYQKDKRHPTPAGTVLQSAVMYATMFHRSPEGFPYKPIGVGTEVDAQTVAKLEKVAWETTKAFFGWK